MGIVLRKIVKNLLKNQSVRPSKKLGQNFLIDKEALKKIIKEADLQPQNTILEIGPGTGSLTLALAKKTKLVVAVEKDSKMIEILKENLKTWGCQNIKIIQGDILKANIQYLISNIHYKVVANLPFYLTAPVIRKFLESDNPPTEMVLVVQKEVAQRICAKPPNMNLLAVSVQFYGEPKIVDYISKESFWPQPKVDSAIIKITPYGNEFTPVKKLPNRELFFKIVKAGFSHPRKQLINNLSKTLKLNKEKVKSWLRNCDISPSQRAETVDLKDWILLAKNFRL